MQINAVSMAPITAVQFGANRLYEQALEKALGALTLPDNLPPVLSVRLPCSIMWLLHAPAMAESPCAG